MWLMKPEGISINIPVLSIFIHHHYYEPLYIHPLKNTTNKLQRVLKVIVFANPILPSNRSIGVLRWDDLTWGQLRWRAYDMTPTGGVGCGCLAGTCLYLTWPEASLIWFFLILGRQILEDFRWFQVDFGIFYTFGDFLMTLRITLGFRLLGCFPGWAGRPWFHSLGSWGSPHLDIVIA